MQFFSLAVVETDEVLQPSSSIQKNTKISKSQLASNVSIGDVPSCKKILRNQTVYKIKHYGSCVIEGFSTQVK